MTATLPTTTILAAIDSARISPLLTDPAGGAATYGPSIVIPGITDLMITPKNKTVDVNGDNQLLRTLTFTNNCDVKFDFSKFSYDLIPYIWGGAIVTAGTDPTATRTWNWSFEQGAFFKIEGRVTAEDIPGADFHLILGRVNVVTPPPIDLKYQDATLFSCAAVAYKMQSTGVAVSTVLNETAVAIA